MIRSRRVRWQPAWNRPTPGGRFCGIRPAACRCGSVSATPDARRNRSSRLRPAPATVCRRAGWSGRPRLPRAARRCRARSGPCPSGRISTQSCWVMPTRSSLTTAKLIPSITSTSTGVCRPVGRPLLPEPAPRATPRCQRHRLPSSREAACRTAGFAVPWPPHLRHQPRIGIGKLVNRLSCAERIPCPIGETASQGLFSCRRGRGCCR